MKHLEFITAVAPALQAQEFQLHPMGLAPVNPGVRYATWQVVGGNTSTTLDGYQMDDARIQLNVSVPKTDAGQQAMSALFAALDELEDIERISVPRPLAPDASDPYLTWTADYRVYP